MSQKRLLKFPLLVIGISAAIVIAAFYHSFDNLTKDFLNKSDKQHKNSLRQLVVLAKSAISPDVQRYAQGSISHAEALKRIRTEVRKMVYEDSYGKNYIFMSLYDGTMLVQPFEPQLEMTNQWDLKDGKGTYIIRELAEAAQRHPAGAFVSYYYYPPDSSAVEEKQAFILGIPELGAYIGTGMYLQKPAKEQQVLLSDAKKLSILYVVLFCLPVLLSIGYIVSRSRALAKSQKQYEDLVENISSVILKYDTNGTITFINDYGERFFGYSRADLVGRNLVGTLINPFDSSGRDMQLMLHNILSKPDDYSLSQSEVATQWGEKIWMEWANKPIRDNRGNVTGIMAVGIDQTARKIAIDALEISERHYRALFESSGDGIILLRKQVVIDANDRALQLFGAERRDFIGKTIRPEDLSPDIQPDGSSSREKGADFLMQAFDGIPQRFEWLHCRLDGSLFHADITLTSIDVTEEPLLMSSIRDISDIKKAQEALRQAEERFKHAFHASPSMKLIVDASTYEIREVNDTFISTMGRSREDLLDCSLRSLFIWQNQDDLNQLFLLLQTGDNIKEFETVVSSNDGVLLNILVSAQRIRYDSRSELLLVLRDVTMKKRRDMELQETRERFHQAFHLSPLSFTISDIQTGRFIEVNDAFCKLFGYSADEAIGMTSFDLGFWCDLADRERLIQKVINEGSVQSIETCLYSKAGEKRSVEMSLSIIQYGERKGLLAISHDVTEIRKKDAELRQSEAKLKSLFNNIPFDLWVCDYHGRYVLQNQVSRNHWGDLIGKKTEDIADKLFRSDWIQNIQRAYAGEVVAQEKEYQSEQGPVYMYEVVAPVFDDNMLVIGILGINIDMTKQKVAEYALSESEKRLQMVFSMSPDFICISDIDSGVFYEANNGLKDALGYTRTELIGKSVFEIAFWADLNDRISFVNVVKQHNKCLNKMTYFRSKSGRILQMSISAVLIDLYGKKCMLSFIRDMTERIELEEQLRQSQKMEAVGKLAGGVAHDFNNVLTGIIGHAHLAKMKLSADNPLLSHLDQILNLSSKAGQSCHSLLAFSRKQVMNFQPVEISDILLRSEKLLERIIGEDIRLIISCEESATVNADSVQIEQVIMNMVLNARDAMPSGGTVQVKGSIVDVDEQLAGRYSLEKGGEFACITISDDGVGMSNETLKKVFEPFFTTKEVGKGTGLGLSMAYGNIQQHGGFITAYSEVDVGSEFRIYLPTMRSVGIVSESQPGELTMPRGSETILLAEDDDDVRALVSVILAEHGYTVIEAPDGDAAVDAYLANIEKIDLIMLDVIMPKRNGKQVYDLIRSVSPTVKVMFLSGYTAEFIRNRAEIGKDACLIYKPVTPHKLLSALREYLNSSECSL